MHRKPLLSAIIKASWNHHQCLRPKKNALAAVSRVSFCSSINNLHPSCTRTPAASPKEEHPRRSWPQAYLHTVFLMSTDLLFLLPYFAESRAKLQSHRTRPTKQKPLCFRSRAFFFVSALLSRLLTLAFFWSSAPLVIWCLGVKSLKLLEVPKPCSAIPFCNPVHSQFHRESPRDHGSARESPGEPGQARESPGEIGKGQ